jgi:hypothetical protein
MTIQAGAALKVEDVPEPTNRQILARLPRPHVVIAGPERLTVDEVRSLRYALEDRKARVTTFRMTDEFRMSEFAEAVEGCAWVLIAVEEYPGRELELLRIVEHVNLPLPNVGFICLDERVNVSNRLHVGGRVDLVVKRVPGDQSFGSTTRARDMVLAKHLTNEHDAASIARAVVRNVPE